LTGEFLVRNLLAKHYITIFPIIVYGIKLNARKKAKDVVLRFFWIILICCFLLVLEDIAESVAALAPALRLSVSSFLSWDMPCVLRPLLACCWSSALQSAGPGKSGFCV
jgi:hypothetical protein